MKVLCKKYLSLLSGSNLYFEKGKYYNMFEMDDSYWIQINGVGVQKFGKDKSKWKMVYLFSEYFYTPQETRKIKLDKIESSL